MNAQKGLNQRLILSDLYVLLNNLEDDPAIEKNTDKDSPPFIRRHSLLSFRSTANAVLTFYISLQFY